MPFLLWPTLAGTLFPQPKLSFSFVSPSHKKVVGSSTDQLKWKRRQLPWGSHESHEGRENCITCIICGKRKNERETQISTQEVALAGGDSRGQKVKSLFPWKEGLPGNMRNWEWWYNLPHGPQHPWFPLLPEHAVPRGGGWGEKEASPRTLLWVVMGGKWHKSIFYMKRGMVREQVGCLLVMQGWLGVPIM